jgi:DNA polymerase-3 subunit delta
MLYLFYREEDDGAARAGDGGTRALSRMIDYGTRALARTIEERYADPAGAFNVQRLDGETAPWGEIVSACSVLPFFTLHQVVRVGGLIGASAQRRAKSGDDPAKPGVSPETLAALVAELPETTLLILEEGALKAGNAHLKRLAALDVPKEIRPTTAPQGPARATWVRDEVTRRGGTIDSGAATLLAQRLTDSLWSLSNAVDTLIAYAGPGGRITADAVATLVVPDEHPNAFHLSDAIAERQAARTLAVLHDLLKSGMAEEQIMAMLVGRIRDWTLAAAVKAERVPEGDALSRLGWNAGKYRMVSRGAASFGRGELPRAYQALVIADEALKSRPGDERPLILDMLVLTLATRGDPAALREMFPIAVVP